MDYYAEISCEQQERNAPFTDENEPLVDISNLEYDEDGYLHFTVTADDYGLEGLYRIYDPTNGDSMTLVSIDYSYLHPIIERQWDRIENALYDITLDRYNAMNRPTLAEDITNNPLESRVAGEELLNAQDLVEELRAVGAEIDENGYVTVYHRTDQASKENINFSHVMKAKEDGLFFSTKENGQNEGYGSKIIKFSIPVEKLMLDDIFSDEAHLRFPLENGIRQLDVSDYLVEEREENMEKENANVAELAQETNYTPIPNRYYEPDLKLETDINEIELQPPKRRSR